MSSRNYIKKNYQKKNIDRPYEIDRDNVKPKNQNKFSYEFNVFCTSKTQFTLLQRSKAKFLNIIYNLTNKEMSNNDFESIIDAWKNELLQNRLNLGKRNNEDEEEVEVKDEQEEEGENENEEQEEEKENEDKKDIKKEKIKQKPSRRNQN